jgi:diguanylate cyclase (GGDEF)-like protein
VLVTAFGVTVVSVFVCMLKSTQDAARADQRALLHLLELDCEQLEAKSLTDGLTGLRNRAALRRDWGRVVDAYTPCAVMMLDVDDFKNVNDTFGHAAGDVCLTGVGEALVAAFGSEACYRYGGDEFLVVAPGWDQDRLEAAIDALRQDLTRVTIGGSHQVRFSGGYVVGHITHDEDLTHLVSLADDNLYRAKRAGKNRIVGGSLGWRSQL